MSRSSLLPSRLLVAVLSLAALAAVAVGVLSHSSAATGAARQISSGGSLGQSSGLLPRSKLTFESALQVNLSNQTVRVPLYPGRGPDGKHVWFTALDASDQGLAENSGLNYAPKLSNVGNGCDDCIQEVTQDNPKPADNRFGQAPIQFKGTPDFSPKRIARPGPKGFPLKDGFQPGAVARDGYSPFIRIKGTTTVYDAPILAEGDGDFDVKTHTNTADRVLRVHIGGKAPQGQYSESWADVLFVKGFDAGQPIVYLSTDAGQPLTAVLERATYVPALDRAAYNGGDDFLGSARERLFGFINGQTGANNKQSQGFQHLILDGHGSEDASLDNKALIESLRKGGDLLNVFGDFPTLEDPRHSNAYSPLWDAQLGLWTDKAVRQGLNKRQIDENVVFNLAARRPDLLTGVDPATGKPAPYGSVGVNINCAVIGYTAGPPTANLEKPAPNSQFPPR